MGKKRKASGAVEKQQSPERSAKLALNSWEDVADEQDEFLLNREKILLDEGVTAKRRKQEDKECMCWNYIGVCTADRLQMPTLEPTRLRY